jgi:hypothetical protein
VKLRHVRPPLVVTALCSLVALSACDLLQSLVTPPVDQLSLDLQFIHALSPSPQVIVVAEVLALSNGHWNPITLSDQQDLTVNGQHTDADAAPPTPYQFTVPRPVAGGEYRIDYTDGHGKQTTVVVPAAQQALTITAPAADSRLFIPQPGASLTLHYNPPFSLTSPFAHDPFARISGTAAGNCKAAPPTPAGTPTATPTEVLPSRPYCISISGSASEMTGTALVSDTYLVPTAGFGNLAPGSGQLALFAEVYGDLPTTSGFAGVRIEFSDSVSIPIIWV